MGTPHSKANLILLKHPSWAVTDFVQAFSKQDDFSNKQCIFQHISVLPGGAAWAAVSGWIGSASLASSNLTRSVAARKEALNSESKASANVFLAWSSPSLFACSLGAAFTVVCWSTWLACPKQFDKTTYNLISFYNLSSCKDNLKVQVTCALYVLVFSSAATCFPSARPVVPFWWPKIYYSRYSSTWLSSSQSLNQCALRPHSASSFYWNSPL